MDSPFDKKDDDDYYDEIDPEKTHSALKIILLLHAIFLFVFAAPLLMIPIQFMDMCGWPVENGTFSRTISSFFFSIAVLSILARNKSKRDIIDYLTVLVVLNGMFFLSFFISMIDVIESRTWNNFAIIVIDVFFLVVWIFYLTDYLEYKTKQEQSEIESLRSCKKRAERTPNSKIHV